MKKIGGDDFTVRITDNTTCWRSNTSSVYVEFTYSLGGFYVDITDDLSGSMSERRWFESMDDAERWAIGEIERMPFSRMFAALEIGFGKVAEAIEYSAQMIRSVRAESIMEERSRWVNAAESIALALWEDSKYTSTIATMSAGDRFAVFAVAMKYGRVDEEGILESLNTITKRYYELGYSDAKKDAEKSAEKDTEAKAEAAVGNKPIPVTCKDCDGTGYTREGDCATCGCTGVIHRDGKNA